MNVHIDGCCNTAADCNDGDGCTADMCSGAGGTCSHMPLTVCVDSGPITPDSGMPGDASVRDAGPRDGGPDSAVDTGVGVDIGPVTLASNNCGCAAAGMGTGSMAAPFGLLGLAWVLARRRRR
jgi:MYXO-CTERM domain-containing protein